ncbi:phosphate/phosphite/phosphonate ABC transporter substrate-binding protein [Streptomyces sp. NPDC001508]|uniref:phosphate/phosphite/phosphonate ABC transporter substrate-binding protein n=1 Tax=Streptomyces sp. NPDC001508 TaxID=3154656 RepID=UPI003316E8EA
MPRHLRPHALAAAVLLPMVLTACGSSAASDASSSSGRENPGTLALAVVPSEDATSTAQHYKPLIKLLEDETGKKVVLQKATNYAAVIEAQRAHKAQIAVYGPLSYIVAKNSGVGLEPIAATILAKGATPGYWSYGFTRATTKDVGGLSDFKGRKVCFVDENSTSGYLYPHAGLLGAGVKDDAYTKVMAGGHDASVLSVVRGNCDVGFSDSTIQQLLIKQGKLKKGDLKLVWKSPVIPGSPVAVSTDLSSELRRQLADVFTKKANADYLKSKGYCDGDDCRIFGYWGYAPVKDSDYKSVRDVCATTGDAQCTAGS